MRMYVDYFALASKCSRIVDSAEDRSTHFIMQTARREKKSLDDDRLRSFLWTPSSSSSCLECAHEMKFGNDDHHCSRIGEEKKNETLVLSFSLLHACVYVHALL